MNLKKNMRHKKDIFFSMGHGVWNNDFKKLLFAYHLAGLNTKMLDFEDLEFMNWQTELSLNSVYVSDISYISDNVNVEV